jgi:hypothetical protein
MNRYSLLVCLLSLAGAICGQRTSGSLSGVVSDVHGVLPDAPIQVKSKATGALVRTVSKEGGRYSFANLPAGSYEFTIFMRCCAYFPFRQEVTVAGGRSTQFDAHLSETINGTTLGDDPARTVDAMLKRAKIPSKPVPRLGGKPDLSGLWLDMGDPYPEDFQLLPWADAVLKQRNADLGKDAPHNHCLPSSLPLPGASTPFLGKIVQTPGLIVLLFEDVGGFRQIFLDGRAHPADVNPTWFGHSVGKWEGDTLVVDTVGFNDRSWLPRNLPHTEMLRVTERYRRVDYGHMEVNVTFDDPGALVKPMHMNIHWSLAPQEELLEFICENNKPEHMVGK